MTNLDRTNSTTLGTTRFIKVPKQQGGATVKPGEGYFQIKIHSAQAAIYGHFWEHMQQLVVTSDVKLNCLPFGDTPIKLIHHIRPLKQNTAETLGLATTLVGLTPANMERVTIAIEYLLDKQNRLSTFAKLINDESFFNVISLASEAAAVAKSLAALSKKIIDTFLNGAGQQPILRFVGDFSLPTGDLSDAYYVILSSRYNKHPLPAALDTSKLEVRDCGLLYEGEPVTHWSYLILDVDTVEARTKVLGRGEPWYEKLDEADQKATQVDIFAEDRERKEAWNSCRALINEADVLLRRAPLYLQSEAKAIIQEAYSSTYNQIFSTNGSSLKAPPSISAEEKSFLEVASVDELQSRITQYEAARSRAQEKLKRLGLLT